MVSPITSYVSSSPQLIAQKEEEQLIFELSQAIKTQNKTELQKVFLQSTRFLSQDRDLRFNPNEIYEAIQTNNEAKLRKAYLKWLTVKAYLLLPPDTLPPQGGTIDDYFDFLSYGQKYFERNPPPQLKALLERKPETPRVEVETPSPVKQKTFFASLEMDSRSRGEFKANRINRNLLIQERLRAGLKMSVFQKDLGVIGVGLRFKTDFALGADPANAKLNSDSAFILWKPSAQLSFKLGKDYSWWNYQTKQYYDLPFDGIGLYYDNLWRNPRISLNIRSGLSFFPGEQNNLLESPCLLYNQAVLQGKTTKGNYETALGTMSFLGTTDLFSLTLNGQYTHQFNENISLITRTDSIFNFLKLSRSSINFQTDLAYKKWLWGAECFIVPERIFLVKPLEQTAGQGFRLKTRYSLNPNLQLGAEYSLNSRPNKKQLDHRFRVELEFKISEKLEK